MIGGSSKRISKFAFGARRCRGKWSGAKIEKVCCVSLDTDATFCRCRSALIVRHSGCPLDTAFLLACDCHARIRSRALAGFLHAYKSEQAADSAMHESGCKCCNLSAIVTDMSCWCLAIDKSFNASSVILRERF